MDIMPYHYLQVRYRYYLDFFFLIKGRNFIVRKHTKRRGNKINSFNKAMKLTKAKVHKDNYKK